MDAMSVNDLFFESIRSLVMIALLAVLFLRGNFSSLAKHPGWKALLAGFCLITAATLLDITDEIPGLEKYVIIGDTIYQAFIEKFLGYLLGFGLVLFGFYKMIPSLQRAEENEKARHESEARFRQIFNAIPDPVILARLKDGGIVDVNRAFEQQTDFTKQQVLGKNSEELKFWGTQDRQAFREQLAVAGEIDNLECEFMLKNRCNAPGLLSARIVNLAGEPCLLAVVRDISKTKEAEKALREMDQIRSDFISTAAHELRTPLSVLIGYSELLTTEKHSIHITEEKKLEFLEEIKLKGLVLSQIVDDLLDISKIEAGSSFNLKLERLDLNALLTKAFVQFQLCTSEHRFRIDLSHTNDLQIECDGQRLLQVLENLLSNAIKYSEKGSLITLDCIDQQDSYTFSVTDEGIGMSEEQVAKIYDKFYRVDASNTAVGGLGLGMSIVKQIVDAMNGSISIDSTPGEGTCIQVTLPKEQVG